MMYKCTHLCEHNCYNTNGSYVCDCQPGCRLSNGLNCSECNTNDGGWIKSVLIK